MGRRGCLLLLLGIVALVVLAVVVIGPTFQASETGAEVLRQAEVVAGDLELTVSATGALQAAQAVTLNFGTVGVVDAVYVQAGDRVHAGQVLARLDVDTLLIAARQAELVVRAQEIAYRRLLEPPTPEEIAVADANVQAAQARYNQAASGANPETVRIAELRYQQTQNSQLLADANLRAQRGAWLYTLSTVPESMRDDFSEQADFGRQDLLNEAAIGQASFAAEAARLQLEQARGGVSSNALWAAGAGIRVAEAQRGQLFAGPTETELERARASVADALVTFAQTRARLHDATIVAPFDGVVSAVNIEVGALPATGGGHLVLADLSRFHVDVDVDEVDIAQIGVGQRATLRLDALPEAEVTATVDRIAPVSSASDGVTSYTVRLALDPTDAPLRDGMTATATIIVHEIKNTLLVPNWAVRLDRERGAAFVDVLRADGTIERDVEIALGARSETVSEALTGLAAGDTVVVSASPAFGTSGSSSGQGGSQQQEPVQ